MSGWNLDTFASRCWQTAWALACCCLLWAFIDSTENAKARGTSMPSSTHPLPALARPSNQRPGKSAFARSCLEKMVCVGCPSAACMKYFSLSCLTSSQSHTLPQSRSLHLPSPLREWWAGCYYSDSRQSESVCDLGTIATASSDCFQLLFFYTLAIQSDSSHCPAASFDPAFEVPERASASGATTMTENSNQAICPRSWHGT